MKYNTILIGERIRCERKKRGWSQEKLIEELSNTKHVNIGRNTLSRIESSFTQDISGFHLDLLIALSELFDCEIGYLLGEYDCHTGRNTDIKEETGLSDKAIDALRSIQQEDEIEEKESTFRDKYSCKDNSKIPKMDLLNFMLGNGHMEHIVRLFRNFIEPQYDVPVYFDKEKNSFIYPDNNFSYTGDVVFGNELLKGEYMIHLADSRDTPNNNKPIGISKTFLETVTLKEVEKLFYIMREIYEQERK